MEAVCSCTNLNAEGYNPHENMNIYSNIPICIQQDATLHSLIYLETALHVSGGTSTHHQQRIQLYLQHLVFVTPLLLSAAIVAGSIYCILEYSYNARTHER
jgi:hypothetical protein